jgi:hypothetical protein
VIINCPLPRDRVVISAHYDDKEKSP